MQRREFVSAALASSIALTALANQPARKWRVGVIGHTGRGNYGHGLDVIWLKLPETEIVAVADADEKGLIDAQKRLKSPLAFADYRAMLDQTKPDIVALAPRYVDQHHSMAMAAIAAGAKGIYAEKPFCRTPAEADEIVAACKKHHVKLALAHVARYHPVIPVVAGLIKEGHLGRLLEIRARGKEDERGGMLDLWVLGSHVLNLAHFFAGNPLSCSATLWQAGKPVTAQDVRDGSEGIGPLAGNEVHARFEMSSGIPLFFDSIAGAGDKAASFGLQLIGNKGLIDIRMDKDPLAHWVAGNPFLPTPEPRPWIPITSAGIGNPEPLVDLGQKVSSHLLATQDLLASLREDRAPLCSAEEGRVTIEMITAVMASHCQTGQRVTWPLAERQNPLGKL